MKKSLFLLPFAITAGCQQNGDSCYPVDGPTDGSALVDFEGATTEYSSTWLRTGSSIQLNLEAEDSMITLRLSQSDDGISADSLEASTSYDFSLGIPDTATATFYPPNSNISSTAQSDTPGNLTLIAFDEQNLKACFSFVAVDNEGNSFELTQGLINASESPLNQ